MLILLLSTAAHAKIIFSSERNGVKGLYVMDDDGSHQIALLEGLDAFPKSWSPDGKQILFMRRVHAVSIGVLFLMDPDGTNIRQLTENDGSYIGKCSFSPDGNFIVYNRIFTKDNKQIAQTEVLNLKTEQREVILDTNASNCDWSPDGKHILYAEALSPGKSSTIWIMGADGHNPRQLLPDPGPQPDNFRIYRSRPRWSPNGQQVVFTEREQKWEQVPNVGNALIYKAFRYMVYDRTGDNLRKLSVPRDWICYGIDWMDDGASVVFTARAGMPMDKLLWGRIDFPACYVYKYHLKTGEITQLTNDPGWDQTIDWISDAVLSVTPRGKKKVTWGAIKE